MKTRVKSSPMEHFIKIIFYNGLVNFIYIIITGIDQAMVHKSTKTYTKCTRMYTSEIGSEIGNSFLFKIDLELPDWKVGGLLLWLYKKN